MTERILIRRFEPTVCQRGIKFTIDNKGVVTIKDHSTDKIVAMVNLDTDPDKNLELAEQIIDTIEEWIVENAD